MNFQEILKDSEAQTLARVIMTEIGLEKEPNAYAGPNAYETRVKAANALADALKRHSDAGERIHPPVNDIVVKVIAAATVFERNRERVTLTQAVIEVAVYGHILMRRVGCRPFDVAMAKAGVESHIVRLLDDEMCRGRCGNFFSSDGCDCDGDCGGGCGSCGGGCGQKP